MLYVIAVDELDELHVAMRRAGYLDVTEVLAMLDAANIPREAGYFPESFTVRTALSFRITDKTQEQYSFWTVKAVEEWLAENKAA